MDLAVGIALGSSGADRALFVAPLLIFASYFVGPNLIALSFNRAEAARCSSPS